MNIPIAPWILGSIYLAGALVSICILPLYALRIRTRAKYGLYPKHKNNEFIWQPLGIGWAAIRISTGAIGGGIHGFDSDRVYKLLWVEALWWWVVWPYRFIKFIVRLFTPSQKMCNWLFLSKEERVQLSLGTIKGMTFNDGTDSCNQVNQNP